jgi:DNA-binding NarL/FixJ family response regulator
MSPRDVHIAPSQISSGGIQRIRVKPKSGRPRGAPVPLSSRLTQREGQIAELIAAGLENKQIAARLGLTEGTIKVYISRLFKRLRLGSRLEVALYICRGKAVSFDPNDRAQAHFHGFGVRNGAD